MRWFATLALPYLGSASLLGQYGFLTEFGGITDEDARGRVQQMVSLDIKEFEFYNACGGFSAPPLVLEESWDGPLGEVTSKKLIRAYIDEISESGGRSWLHVQMQATDPDDGELQKGATFLGQWKVAGDVLLDLVVPNEAWARTNAPRWAAFAKRLGFQGIHWSTFGDWMHAGDKGADTYGFLRKSSEVVREYGLIQTCSFIDGFGWDERIRTENLVAFNYYVVFETPTSEEEDLERWLAPFPGVYAAWPGKSPAHTNEKGNAHVVGMSPYDVLTMRWRMAMDHNSSYLAVGDGLRRLQTDVYSNSVPLNVTEVDIIRKIIRTSTTSTTTGTSTSTSTSTTSCGGEETDPQEGVLQITPGGEDMVDALKERKTEYVKMIKNMRGACWVNITDFVSKTGTDGTQSVSVRFQLREAVVLRRLQQLRALQEPPIVDATMEVQAAMGSHGPKVESASFVNSERPVEPPDSAATTSPDKPGRDKSGMSSLLWM